MKLSSLAVIGWLVVLAIFMATLNALPIGNPEVAIENMRQIPQWHCLRYRKFDLVRRCRNYRVGRKH